MVDEIAVVVMLTGKGSEASTAVSSTTVSPPTPPMRVVRAHRFEMKPNNVQRTHFERSAGTARFTWNWALAERQRRYRENEGKERFTNAIEQHRVLNLLKDSDFPWMREVSKCVPQEALRNLDNAYKLYRIAKKAGRKARLPKFKKKGKCRDSFTFTTGAIRAEGTHVVLPRIGMVRVKEAAILAGRVLRASVSREADRWFVSFSVEEEGPAPVAPTGPPIGVDLGITHMATLSDGRTIENPKPLKAALRKIQRFSRELHRRKKGSSNRSKTAGRLAKAYWRIGNIRRDALHKTTTALAKNHSEIVIEDLNVRGMVQNRRLARAISDVGMADFRRMLEYKCRWYGSRLTVAPRFYRSTKRCSRCGNVKNEMPLSVRTYECECCGLVLDRDLNAALNLVAESSVETLNAGGDLASTVSIGAPRAESMKQEMNATIPHGIGG